MNRSKAYQSKINRGSSTTMDLLLKRRKEELALGPGGTDILEQETDDDEEKRISKIRELAPQKVAQAYFEGVDGYFWTTLQIQLKSDKSGKENIRLMDQLGAMIYLNQDLTPQELWDQILIDPTQIRGYTAFEILKGSDPVFNISEVGLAAVEITDTEGDSSPIDFGLVNFEMKKHALNSKKKRKLQENEAEQIVNTFIGEAASKLNAIRTSAESAKDSLDSDIQNMIQQLNVSLSESVIDNTSSGQAAINELKLAGTAAKERIGVFYRGSLSTIGNNTKKLLGQLKAYLTEAQLKLTNLQTNQQSQIDNLYSSFKIQIQSLIPGFTSVIAAEGKKRYESHKYNGAFTSDVQRFKGEAALGASNDAQKDVYKVANNAVKSAWGEKDQANSKKPDSKADFELELSERTGNSKNNLQTEYARTEALLNKKAELDQHAALLQLETYKIRVDEVTIAGIQAVLERTDTQHTALDDFTIAKNEVIALFYKSAIEKLFTGTEGFLSEASQEIESFIRSQQGLETPKTDELKLSIENASERFAPSIDKGNSFVMLQKESNKKGIEKLTTLIQTEFSAIKSLSEPKMQDVISAGKEKIEVVKERGIEDQLQLRIDHYRSILHDIDRSKGAMDSIIVGYEADNKKQIETIRENLASRIEKFKKDAQKIVDELDTRMDEAENSPKVVAAQFHEAIMAGDEDKVNALLRDKSPAAMNSIDRQYYNLYSNDRYGRNLYAELYNFQRTFLDSTDLWAKFSPITDKDSSENRELNIQLVIEGLGKYAPEGSNFTVNLSPIWDEISSGDTINDLYAEHILYKTPESSKPKAKEEKQYYLEIEDASVGIYDFIFFVTEDGGKQLFPLRIQQRIKSISSTSEEILKHTPGVGYADYLANLEYARIQLGGGVTLEQGIGADLRIIMSGASNPSFYGDSARFKISSKEKGFTYDWYAYQISYGLFDQKDWPLTLSDYYSPQHKQFGKYDMTFQGTGDHIYFTFDEVSGTRIIVAEQIGANGKPTGKIAQYIQKTLETRYDPNSPWDKLPNSESEQYKGLQEATKNAQEKIKYIKGEAIPIRAGYVNTESGTQMSLPLYIGKSANPSKGKYVIVDLLPNQKHFHYYGDTSAEALEAFESGNLYPTGYIFIKIDKNDQGIKENSLTIETNGMSTWERFTTTTGWASIGLFIGGAILEFVPGGQVAGSYMIVASMTLGVTTGLVNIYERMQYGELDGGFVTLEVMNIVGSMLAGGGKVITMLTKPGVALGKLGQFVYYTGEGLDLVDGVFLTVAGAERLVQILESDMPAAQKRVEMVKAISSLILGSYLIANVGGSRNKTPHKNADETIENTSIKTNDNEVVTSKEKVKFEESSLKEINSKEISETLKSKILKELSPSDADDLLAELVTNSTLKTAMEADEILPLVWKRINDGIPSLKTHGEYLDYLKKFSKFAKQKGGTGTVTYYRVQGGISRQHINIDELGNVTFKKKTINISIGNLEHARHFQQIDSRAGSKIYAFDVPKWFDDFVKESAIPQWNAGSNKFFKDAPQLGDVTTPGDSFTFPQFWSKEFAENYIKGSGKIIE